jgi:hypothetical protein
MRRALSLLGAVVLSAPALVGLSAGAAHAGIGDPTCTETEAVTYSPGLSNTEELEDVTVDNNLTCTSLSDPTLRSGHVGATVDGIARSCTDLLSTSSGSYTIYWNNGRTSTISYTRVPDYADGSLVITEDGTVTAGEFYGDTSVHVAELADLDLTACDTSPGITSTSGTGFYIFA